MNSLLFGYR